MSKRTPFKTPRLPGGMMNGGTPRPKGDYLTPLRAPPSSASSDSQESFVSDGSGSSNNDMSILAQFDDFMRIVHHLEKDYSHTTSSFYDLFKSSGVLWVEYRKVVEECRRMREIADEKAHECVDLESKLAKARQMLDRERLSTANMKRTRDDLAAQLDVIRQHVNKGAGHRGGIQIPEETCNKLSFLNSSTTSTSLYNNNNNENHNWENNQQRVQLSAIREINSTGSLLSDFSYSQSEDDLDTSKLRTNWNKHRPSCEGLPQPPNKKRKSTDNKAVEINTTDTVRATTTLTVTTGGPIHATSVIESVPKTPIRGASNITSSASTANIPTAPQAHMVLQSWNSSPQPPAQPQRAFPGRPHNFENKVMIVPDTCTPCDKRIRFGKTAAKCADCKAVCHQECKENLPLPCVPQNNTPGHKNAAALGEIGDYTPTTPPMVPALIVHCVNEIEMRGLREIGIYRIPGSERDVKALKERFLKGRGAPCLNQIDVHVVCGTVKDFLRSLSEPLVTTSRWREFVEAVLAGDESDRRAALYQLISDLPQPNRDTLAYMVLHLQRVAVSIEAKMSASNLSKILGPTIVGYSSKDLEPAKLMEETCQATMVMEQLINIPSDYWSSFINVDFAVRSSKLQQTPSTDSLLRYTTSRGIFTPNRGNRSAKRKQQFFSSPTTK